MRPIYKRYGVWMFVAAVVWYSLGNITLTVLHKRSVEQATIMHTNERHIGMNGVSRVLVRTTGINTIYVPLNIVFDPDTRQAEISNKNLNIEIEEKIDNGLLTITVNRNTVGQYVAMSRVALRLPSSVSQFEIGAVRNVEISGSFLEQGAIFNVNLLNCDSTVTFKNISVHQLDLTTSCKPVQEQPCCQNNSANGFDSEIPGRTNQRPVINLSDVAVINKLELTMRYGILNYFAPVIPERIQLNLGDEAEISAHRTFLQNARYATLP